MSQIDNVRIGDADERIVEPAAGFTRLANGLEEMRILPNGEVIVRLRGQSYRVVVVNWTGVRGLFNTLDGTTVHIWKPSRKSLKPLMDTRFKGNDGITYAIWKSLIDSLSQQGTLYPEKGTCNPAATLPILVVTECTFESYNYYYGKIAAMMAVAPNPILTFSTRNTARTRFDEGTFWKQSTKKEDLEKKDRDDAGILYRQLVKGRLHLKVAQSPAAPQKGDFREAFEIERRNGTLPNSGIAQHVLKILPPIMEQPTEFRLLFGDGGAGYNLENVIPVFIAFAESDKTRDDFERRAGIYNGGYPSFLRATLYRLTMGSRQGRRAAQKRNEPLPGIARMLGNEAHSGQSVCRRETRRLFHLFNGV